MNTIPLNDLKAQYMSIKEEIDNAIAEVLNNARFISGPETKQFEENFSKYCGAKHGVGTSSGTTAITLALLTAGIKPGDEVITTPATFVATAEAIYETGAKTVFVDIEPNCYGIDPSKIEEKITDKTKAVLPVHLYGRVADMDGIKKIAEENNLTVIEDAAEAHGATYKGKKAPIIKTATYSFYPSKTLGAYGDAGMIVTNDESFYQMASMLVDHGRKRNEKYKHHYIGHNYRIDEIQAAILNVKLKYLDRWIEKRREHARTYNKLLSEKIVKPADLENHGLYVYAIRVNNRDKLVETLKEKGVGSVIHFPIPLHLQPAFSGMGHKEGDFPEAEKLCREVLSLPLYPELSQEQIEYVAKIVNQHSE